MLPLQGLPLISITDDALEMKKPMTLSIALAASVVEL
jgi:hypothetical protein